MKWYYNLKISVKLLLGFFIVALIAGAVGIVGIVNISSIDKKYSELYEQYGIALGYIGNASTDFQVTRNLVRNIIIEKGNDSAGNVNKIKQYDKEIDDYLASFQKSIKTQEVQNEFNNLKTSLEKYRPIRERIITLAAANHLDQAIVLMNSDGAPLASSVEQSLKKLVDSKTTIGKQKSDEYSNATDSTVVVMIIIVLIAIIAAVVLGIFISRIINKPIRKLVETSDRLAAGDVDLDIEATTKDEIGTLMASFSKMISNIRSQSEAANKIANGDLSVEVKAKSDKDILSKSMKQVVDTLRSLISDMDSMSKEHDAGDIDVFIAEDKFNGAYKTMAQGVNKMVKGHINVKKKAMACISEFAKGNFNAELEKFPGKKAFINENIEALRKNLKDVNTEITKLIAASNEGKLSERADTIIFTGDWKELMKGLNGLIDAIIEPIQEASGVLEEMAKGNLGVSVRGNYKGDHAKIKNALNDTISTLSSYVSEISNTLTEMANGNLIVGINKEYRGNFAEIKDSLNNIIKSLNDVLNDINNSSLQVAAGSRQVSNSAQALSQGSTEQASSIEELTASMEEIASQTRQNATNANQANELALSAKKDALKGNEQMKEMLKAMGDINESSANISKIIKVIDEIAFQTNILALNAAVEAARAGQHGKGFAVVAEEVRNLAARSANAAKETTALIEGSIVKVEGGTKIANDTAEALNKIVDGIAEAAMLVGDIAAASNEQATGIAQVNQGIMQVSQVTQTNSATAEESAAASEELSGQAETLKEMVGRFKLKKSSSSYSNLEELNPEVLKMIENMSEKKKSIVLDEAVVASPRKASFKHNQFGKY